MQSIDLQSHAEARIQDLQRDWVTAARLRELHEYRYHRRRLALGERLRVALTGWVELPEAGFEPASQPQAR
ncbi:MAG: hypothetical protein IT303_15365 [Dehalococcoidia bacterium]|nr:hypothetical protein [Dehalococcoidia bacterium]